MSYQHHRVAGENSERGCSRSGGASGVSAAARYKNKKKLKKDIKT
ncbi:hypothetical protein [Bacteroides sp.]|nr:hypothetical protein [Bacteroides sp.]MDD3040984.1 hypothetical protein [Bacteroides sp.]